MQNKNSFEDIIKHDNLKFDANPAIEQRLMYHFQLKTASNHINKNHIFSFITELLKPRFVGIKIGLASLLVVALIGYNQINTPEEINLKTDTASVSLAHDSLCYKASNDSVLIH
jgi:hypothetical protein